jgi:hypothetical protein
VAPHNVHTGLFVLHSVHTGTVANRSVHRGAVAVHFVHRSTGSRTASDPTLAVSSSPAVVNGASVTVHVCLSSGDVQGSADLSLHKHAEAPGGLWHSHRLLTHCGQQSTKLTDRLITTFVCELKLLFRYFSNKLYTTISTPVFQALRWL